MDLFHSPPFIYTPQASIASIGNFDGMHLGHQALLQQLIYLAQQKKLKSTVILFEPQPLEFLRSHQSPARLQTLTDKLSFLKKTGIDQVVALRFDQKFSHSSPEYFVEHWLMQQLAVQALLVGEDFRFGHKRLGSIDLLKQYEKQNLLEVFLLPLVKQQAIQISSTEIRRQLNLGDFAQATQLLGYPFVITGRVLHGAKVGRLLGFPTINVALHRKISPLQGVYAVRVKMADNTVLFGVANIGVRPTIVESLEPVLEVFLFTEKNLDLYTQRVTVEFLIKVRDEQRFDSLEKLRAQIEQDVAWTQAYIKSVS